MFNQTAIRKGRSRSAGSSQEERHCPANGRHRAAVRIAVKFNLL